MRVLLCDGLLWFDVTVVLVWVVFVVVCDPLGVACIVFVVSVYGIVFGLCCAWCVLFWVACCACVSCVCCCCVFGVCVRWWFVYVSVFELRLRLRVFVFVFAVVRVCVWFVCGLVFVSLRV